MKIIQNDILIEFAIEKAGTIKAKILTIRTAFSVGCSRPNNLAILVNVSSVEMD
jgi:hypothetical protein